MKQLNQTADKIFRKIIELANGGSYLKLNYGGEGIMPAIFEKLHSVSVKGYSGDVWSVAHYFNQEGDMCCDPDMTFLVTANAIFPLSFEMQGSALARHEQSVIIADGTIKFRKQMQLDHQKFANQWLVNIKHQQLDNMKNVKPEQPEEQVKEDQHAAEPDNKVLYELVDYSEKAVAVFGDTKPIKEDLKGIGGRFNPYLKKNGVNVPGWIFSKNKLADLKNLLSL